VKRRPNPWIVIPSVGLGLLAGALGWVVTDLSCRESSPVSGCPPWTWLVTIVSFLSVTIGVGLLLVLVYRSLSEWREGSTRTGRAD
jgi:hypothetical protein